MRQMHYEAWTHPIFNFLQPSKSCLHQKKIPYCGESPLTVQACSI
jgi:hypothetical protein